VICNRSCFKLLLSTASEPAAIPAGLHMLLQQVTFFPATPAHTVAEDGLPQQTALL
jgi:hypothetical protein